MSVPAAISSVSVNGVTENVAAIQGAGVVVYLSALTNNINEVVIEYAGGTAKLQVKNDNVSEEEPTEEITTVPETTTDEPTEEPTEIETTTKAEDTVPFEVLEMTELVADNEWYKNGEWSYLVGPWNGSTAQMGIDPEDPDHIQIQQLTCTTWDAWGVQLEQHTTML